MEIWISNVVKYFRIERDSQQAKAYLGGINSEPCQVAADAAGWAHDQFCDLENERVDLTDDVIGLLNDGIRECNQVDDGGPLSHYAPQMAQSLEDLIEEMTGCFHDP